MGWDREVVYSLVFFPRFPIGYVEGFFDVWELDLTVVP
jgi:hypothetical protein